MTQLAGFGRREILTLLFFWVDRFLTITLEALALLSGIHLVGKAEVAFTLDPQN